MDSQHIEIEIPVIEIAEGWAAEDCVTDEQCDDAFSYLMAAIAQIEFQIDMEHTKHNSIQNKEWIARAKCALKFKNIALQIVNQQRAKIKRAIARENDKRLLTHIRGAVGDAQFNVWAKQIMSENALAQAAE